ncbi:hypothetical protein ACET3Z_011487 [Daucus carota]
MAGSVNRSVKFRFINATRNTESHQLYLTPRANTENLECNICKYPIHGRWYRDGHNYNICGYCVDTFVQPISNNKLDVTREFMNRVYGDFVARNEYNQMTSKLCSDLRCMGVTCSMCRHPNRRPKWAYVNTYNGHVYACHIGCVVARVGANQRDDNFVFDTNPTWRLVGRVSLSVLRNLATNLVPPPFNSAVSIFLKLLAYQAHSRRHT